MTSKVCRSIDINKMSSSSSGSSSETMRLNFSSRYSKRKLRLTTRLSYLVWICSCLVAICSVPASNAFELQSSPTVPSSPLLSKTLKWRNSSIRLPGDITQLYSRRPSTTHYNMFEDGSYNRDRPKGPKRRGRGKVGIISYFSTLFRGFSLQQWIVYFNVLFYVLQVLSAVNYVPTLNRYLSRFGYRPISTSKIIEQNVWGGAPVSLRLPTRRVNSYGPFTTDFYFVSGKMAELQPHRYLTAGFLHGSVIHLLLNMQALSRLPPLLENGLGWPIYLATYLTSIVSGNIAHNVIANGGSPCLGASGGICGLNGLLFSTLRKMGRDKESNVVLNNMFTLVIYGLMSARVSNAGHIGGFIAGAAMGHLFSPQFRKSYVSRRSRWNTDETAFQNSGLVKNGFTQTDSKIPISYFYVFVAFAILTKASFRRILPAIVKGFVKPGSLGGVY